MPKSNAILLAVTNFLFIYMICLSTSGVGWEVSPDTISTLRVLSIISTIFTLINIFLMVIHMEDFLKLHNGLKYVYIVNIITSIVFLLFIFISGAFYGQFWFENFPEMGFFIIANFINIGLLVLTLIGFKDKRTGQKE